MENVSKSVNITKSDHVKAEVILGQGQRRRGVHINIFRANAQKVVARSYASVEKGPTKAPTNVQKYCKGGSSGLPNTP